MANSDKNILITPNVGAATGTLPNIIYRGADNTPITMRVLDNGTLSFEATAGQLFSISDGLTGSIFSVNDISGIPSIEVLDTGLVKLNQYNGQTVIGGASAAGTAELTVYPSAAANLGLVVRGVTSQSGNLQEWQNSGGTALASVSSAGAFTVPSLTVSGDLTVNGTTTNINTTNLLVEDKNIIIGDVATPSNTTADGGGITLKGATDKTFNWVNATSSWTSSEDIDLATGKVLRIAGTQVLSATQYTGNAATVTNGIYTTSSFNLGTTSIALNRASASQTLTGVSIDGNAGTVTNGVYTSGSYADPTWITSLSWSKISSTPTTLSGYGITDALNTSATAQTKSGSLTASSFIRSGGTSSQFLKADGSVDSNTYLTTTSASNTYATMVDILMLGGM